MRKRQVTRTVPTTVVSVQYVDTTGGVTTIETATVEIAGKVTDEEKALKAVKHEHKEIEMPVKAEIKGYNLTKYAMDEADFIKNAIEIH